MVEKGKVLVVDDDGQPIGVYDDQFVEFELKKFGPIDKEASIEVREELVKDVIKYIDENPDLMLVILDWNLGEGVTTYEIVKNLKGQHPNISFAICTSDPDEVNVFLNRMGVEGVKVIEKLSKDYHSFVEEVLNRRTSIEVM